MTLLIDNQQSRTEDLQGFFEETLNKTLEFLNLQIQVEVSLLLVENEEIQHLNRDYRGIDNATDVLSFPMLNLDPSDRETWLEELESGITADDQQVILGDIVISVEKAEEQAKEYGHGLKRELGFLMIHGVLHLLGYDHEKGESEEQAMDAIQDAILEELSLPR
ncbi:MAG: rRNA maturation RNase YbeY [Clostridiales bacterium]|jgi:probable rRNA maturation factor|nr:rRNA maturation RNase YbeY [Clostridiales bacterium]